MLAFIRNLLDWLKNDMHIVGHVNHAKHPLPEPVVDIKQMAQFQYILVPVPEDYVVVYGAMHMEYIIPYNKCMHIPASEHFA
jgi:hypothetical protein